MELLIEIVFVDVLLNGTHATGSGFMHLTHCFDIKLQI